MFTVFIAFIAFTVFVYNNLAREIIAYPFVLLKLKLSSLENILTISILIMITCVTIGIKCRRTVSVATGCDAVERATSSFVDI